MKLLVIACCFYYVAGAAFRGPQHSHVSTKSTMNVGLLLPYTNFGVREYTKAINNAVAGLHKSQKQRRPEWLKKYTFSTANVHSDMMKLTPSPTGFYSYFIDVVLEYGSVKNYYFFLFTWNYFHLHQQVGFVL